MDDHRPTACLSASDNPAKESLSSLEETATALWSKPAAAVNTAAVSAVPSVKCRGGSTGVAAGSTAGLHSRSGVTGVDSCMGVDRLGEAPKSKSSAGRTLDRKAAWEVRASSLNICLEEGQGARQGRERHESLVYYRCSRGRLSDEDGRDERQTVPPV